MGETKPANTCPLACYTQRRQLLLFAQLHKPKAADETLKTVCISHVKNNQEYAMLFSSNFSTLVLRQRNGMAVGDWILASLPVSHGDTCTASARLYKG